MVKKVKKSVLMKTFSGRTIDIENFKEEDIDLRDIAISLSRQRRYNGQTAVPWSVAQHLILCSMIATMLGLDDDVQSLAFLHDVEETWVQDVNYHIKHNYMLGNYETMCEKVSDVVYSYFGLSDKYQEHKGIIKDIDRAAYHVEAISLIPQYRFSAEDFDESTVEIIKKVIEMEFVIPDDLLHMPELDAAQTVFEVLNVFDAEHKFGQKISTEPQTEDA